jgi:hypothetical protein
MVNVPIEWLSEKVDEAPTSYLAGRSPTTALRLRSAWQRLRIQAREGDEVWAFSSPATSWHRASRYEGFALVRGGAVQHVTFVDAS